MGLLERVGTLVRANLNDLVDRAENPSKMIKQVILDMENQLLQLKTQVAISIADQHMLEKREQENSEKAAEWLRKAELAVDKGQDDLARTALERQISADRTKASFHQQTEDQHAQVVTLKGALNKLEQKLAEAQAKSDMLIAQHRRARALGNASDAQMAIGGQSAVRTFERMTHKVRTEEAVSQAKAELIGDDVEDRFAQLERDDEVSRRLAELKGKRGATA
jgi:phage shock protein A